MFVLSEIGKISICDIVVGQFADLFNDYDACKANVSWLNSRK